MSEENVVRGVRYPISLPSGRAARQRTLDERLFLRFQGLFRLFGAVWMRLPPRSRLRRLLVTRLVVRGIAAANRRDFDLLFLGFDPDIEYRPPDDQIAPDQDAVYYGHSGYREMWRKWIDAFDDLRLEPEELLDMGDKLLATVQVRGHGAGSGVPVDGLVFQMWELRRGLIVWQQDFVDRTEALEVAAQRE
jgi:ketosteroid isomerase-like protein